MSDLLPPLRRLAAVHDLSGLGKCSLTVALPIVSATGVECACIPTAVLSTHTGEFTGWTLRDLHEDMVPIARHWASTGAAFDGVYSGYLATPEQTAALREIIRLLARPDFHVIVDPVMADNGSYYSNLDDRMCRAFRALLSDADVVTPNVTEAALLADMPYRHDGHDEAYLRALAERLSALGPGTVVITGARPTPGEIGNLAYDRDTGALELCVHEAHPGFFYGTGDIFAAALAALLVRGAPVSDALRIATDLTDACIRRSLRHDTPRRFGVDFEGALPDYIRSVEKLFS
ncbi:MAG: pyridoxamine kinase [Oscillospiraceae bacterium]|nr:pyridoxamine kinase [Oscillospiraceae bacterium]